MLRVTKRSLAAVALMLAFGELCSYPAYAETGSKTPLVNQISAKLARGDLVRLRSGGPLMIVNAIKGDQVDCVWTDWNGQPNDATFPAYVLQRF
jgi:uncharacterized protein YodC (DUF2158 family)